MNTLIIINDAPYGSEKAYNALRLAMALQKDNVASDVRIFLLARKIHEPSQNKGLSSW